MRGHRSMVRPACIRCPGRARGAGPDLRDDINKKLAQNPTAISGITLRLRRIPVTEERTANDVLDMLEQHFAMLPHSLNKNDREYPLVSGVFLMRGGWLLSVAGYCGRRGL